MLGRSLPIAIASDTKPSEHQYRVGLIREKDELLTLAIRRYPRPVGCNEKGSVIQVGGSDEERGGERRLVHYQSQRGVGEEQDRCKKDTLADHNHPSLDEDGLNAKEI